MRKLATVATLLVGVMLVGSGCMGRLIDEGIEKGLGPTAKTMQMDPKWPAQDQNYLAAYKNFEVGQLRSEFPDTPALFTEYFPGKLREQLVGKGLPVDQQGKTLVIDVDILGYQPVRLR